MIAKIVDAVFEKARKECSSQAKSTLSTHIADEIMEQYGNISYQTVLRAYKKYIDPKDEEIGEPIKENVELLCKYIGYKNYKEFSEAYNSDSRTEVIEELIVEEKTKRTSKWFQSTALLAIILILGVLVFFVSGIGKDVNTITNQCMVWNSDRYEPIACDAKILPKLASQPIAYNEHSITNFRKITFDEIDHRIKEGTVKKLIWYGKATDGSTDYFTASGKHPVTGVPLVGIKKREIKVEQNDSTASNEPTGILESEPSAASAAMAVYIFEDLNWDRSLSTHLGNGIFKSYQNSNRLNIPDNLDSATINRLLNGNVTYFNKGATANANLCSGTVNYTFKTSSINSTMVSCFLKLSYRVYNANGVEQKNLYQSKTYTAIGFSEDEAKENAIKKIKAM